jgi:hypothetical protein
VNTPLLNHRAERLFRCRLKAIVPENACASATNAIVVEGPGKRGETVQVCADPECELHSRPNHRAEDEEARRMREEERNRRELERDRIREANRRLLDTVLGQIPAALTRDDYQMLVFAAIDRLEYEDWEAITERHGIDADESQEPDAASFELRKKAQEAKEPQLIRMLIEIALLRSGYSDEKLGPTDALVLTADRYAKGRRTQKARSKEAKCAKAKQQPKRRVTQASGSTKKSARKGGAA